MAKKKTKQFKAHKNLLMDVIRRQAGTLGKAILEGVMNSVDAGATFCDIVLDPEIVIITDDGSGFPNEEAIDDCFNQFGHDDPDAYQRKTYGNFRMGRGQMFAFGHNVWQSGRFEFDVDVKERGLDWTLDEEGEEEIDGCQVTIYLYHKLSPSELDGVRRELERAVKWVNIPVTINDEQISNDPDEAKWDYESDNCYVKLKTTGGLAVYNLGVFVKEFGGHIYGRGGEVVSKQQLRLNFARNDVMVSECPIWKEVTKFVRSQAEREIARKPTMNNDERQRIADMMRTGESQDRDLLKKKVFTDVLGRQWSLAQLHNNHRNYPCYTSAHQGDRRGDRLHQQRLAFVFANVTLERFGCTGARALMKLIRDMSAPFYTYPILQNWKFKEFHEIAAELSTRMDLVPEKEYTADEQLVYETCEYASGVICGHVNNVTSNNMQNRKIRIGIADAVEGWTDGETYIAIERKYIKRLSLGSISAWVKLGELLLHEYCHDAPDTDTHTHTMEFFQMYHDATHQGCVALFAEDALRYVPTAMDRVGRKMTKRLLSGQDKLHNLEEKSKKFEKVAART